MTAFGLLRGRAALVTGGFNGLGRAIVDRFAAEGALGVAVDVEEGAADLPPDWRGMTADVADEVALAEIVAETVSSLGALDIVVANAGVVPPWSTTEAVDLAEWDRVFAVNVRGVMATIKHAVPAMKSRGGSIIVMASLNSWRAHARQCLYTATKHAALGIVRATALDLGQYGIRVNGIGPGPVATDALKRRVERRAAEGGPSSADVFAAMAAEGALDRIATAEEVASTAVFLASDLSSALTGTLVPVDCGLI